MTQEVEHRQRAWWNGALVWFIVIAAVLALVIGIAFEAETTGKAAAISYGMFLDQLEAGNVASVTFQGTAIEGNVKKPLGGTQRNAFSTRVPDVGDPALIPELRKQHAAIDVGSPSPWTWLLAHLPWPMLAFLAVILLAALARLVRGGRVASGSAASTLPAHGMLGLLSGFLAKRRPSESSPEDVRDAEARARNGDGGPYER